MLELVTMERVCSLEESRGSCWQCVASKVSEKDDAIVVQTYMKCW